MRVGGPKLTMTRQTPPLIQHAQGLRDHPVMHRECNQELVTLSKPASRPKHSFQRAHHRGARLQAGTLAAAAARADAVPTAAPAPAATA